MRYRLSGNSRAGMHIVRRQTKKTRSLCGKPVGQDTFLFLPKCETIKQNRDDDPICPACFGHYANTKELAALRALQVIAKNPRYSDEYIGNLFRAQTTNGGDDT